MSLGVRNGKNPELVRGGPDGSDTTSIKTFARRDGDSFVVSGQKCGPRERAFGPNVAARPHHRWSVSVPGGEAKQGHDIEKTKSWYASAAWKEVHAMRKKF